MVWFILIFLFRSYLRLFNKPLGVEVASRFGKCQQTCINSWVTADLTDQFDSIKTQLDLITQKLESDSQSQNQSTTTPNSLFQTTTPTKVALYYFNQIADQKLAPEQQINISSLLPVYRVFPASKNLLIDTINELIKWNLTATEISQWFTTEFPNSRFVLLWADLAADGILTLEFSEVPWFTDGGSARMLILWNVIKKTAIQFPGVKEVVFVPETLFQP